MKKMIMAVAIVCAAVYAHASAVSWGISSGTLDAEKFASGTAYLICVDSLAKPAAFADDAAALAWLKDNGSSLSSKALMTGTVENGTLWTTESKDEAIGRKSYWMAIVNGDSTAFAITTATKAINITTSTLGVTAGWTATQTASYAAVPEPTSGLLLLLGMAGLALKRKRA